MDSPPTPRTVNIRGKEYEVVASRVERFNHDRGVPPGPLRLRTKLLSVDEVRVVFMAWVEDAEGTVWRTGHAEERWDASTINKMSAVENCETSAVGRCLAFYGLAGTELASADEVANAIRQTPARKTTPPQQAAPRRGMSPARCPDCGAPTWPNLGRDKGQRNFRCSNNSCAITVWECDREGLPIPEFLDLLRIHEGANQ